MKKKIFTLLTGLFIGAVITGGASAYTAGILAERSTNRIVPNKFAERRKRIVCVIVT